MAEEGTWKSLLPVNTEVTVCYHCGTCVIFFQGGDRICAPFWRVILTLVVLILLLPLEVNLDALCFFILLSFCH